MNGGSWLLLLVLVSLILVSVAGILYSVYPNSTFVSGIITGIISGLIVYIAYYAVEIDARRRERLIRELNAKTIVNHAYEDFIAYIQFTPIGTRIMNLSGLKSIGSKDWKGIFERYAINLDYAGDFERQFRLLKRDRWGIDTYNLFSILRNSLIEAQWGFYDEKNIKLVIGAKMHLGGLLQELRDIVLPKRELPEGVVGVVTVRPYAVYGFGKNFVYAMSRLKRLNDMARKDILESFQ